MTAIDAIIVGAGSRGNAYGQYALEHPRDLRVVGVAEPDPLRRDRFVGLHDIAPDMVFDSWQSLLASSRKRASTVINCTMDRFHFPSTMRMLELGYDVLLEKPMTPVLRENIRLVRKAEESGRLLQVCHVLRYTPFWQTLREVVQSGRLGRIVSVTHRENLITYHMAHSFVRGNWRQQGSSGPMILSKCCHDFDVLLWILGKRVTHLSSFGSLCTFGRKTRRRAPPSVARTAARLRTPANMKPPSFMRAMARAGPWTRSAIFRQRKRVLSNLSAVPMGAAFTSATTMLWIIRP